METENSETKKKLSTKATVVVVAIIFTISVSGFFMGLRQTVRETQASSSNETTHSDDDVLIVSQTEPGQVREAVSYAQLSTAGFSPNANWSSHLAKLTSTPHSASTASSTTLASEIKRRLRREARRAFDGAPPIVPHPIDQHSAASCLQCHAQATQIGSIVAPAMSHPEYSSCTQCHVSDKGLGSTWNTSEFDLHTGNQFTGKHQPTKGQRAYPDAPPTIPHTVHMRQNCISCHGPLGTSPLVTTHPERQSCTQCHVPEQSVDAAYFAESPFPLLKTENNQDAQ